MHEGGFDQSVMPPAESPETQKEAEQERIYENPIDDPEIKEAEQNITRLTNRFLKESRKGQWGDIAEQESGSKSFFDRHFDRTTMQQWDTFISQHPEKSAAYRETFEPIKEAFARQERLRNSRERKTKEERLEQIRSEVEKIAGADGKPIDEGIKETIVALKAFGFETFESCDGHAEYGRHAPFVEMGAPNKPEEKFEGQNALFQKTAEKYGMPVEDVENDTNHEAYVEAWKALSKSDAKEMQEYQVWKQETAKLLKQFQELLGEFYRHREVPNDTRLVIEGDETGFEIHNGGSYYKKFGEVFAPEEERGYKAHLSRYRSEMEEFTKFLKQKYLSQLPHR